MRLTREKVVRISHQIVDLLVQSNEVEFVEDRDGPDDDQCAEGRGKNRAGSP